VPVNGVGQVYVLPLDDTLTPIRTHHLSVTADHLHVRKDIVAVMKIAPRSG
jgi:hypothetical protein